MQAQITRITDIIRRDDGISGAMHYTEQISWILFLKFVDEYDKSQKIEADLAGRSYSPMFEEMYRRDTRAVPKTADGVVEINAKMGGGDIKEFVDTKLFPYLKGFRETGDFQTMQYKIGEIFAFMDNRIENGHTLREILDIVDGLSFQSKDDLFELSKVYEDLLHGMGHDGGNSGEFYTPRPIIKAIVQCMQPTVGQTVYDGALGSAGFLIEAYDFLRPLVKTANDLHFLHHETFFGNEKTPIAYVMGVMNLILHGIQNPHIQKINTLTEDIRGYEEKDKHDIILANPPFGGKEKDQIQSNFPIKTNATEMLFLQHFAKKLKTGGKAAVVVPEGVLFNTSGAFQSIKQMLLEDFNLHSIISLPAGVFLPYSGVKTNVIFFDKTHATTDIWYYDLDPGRTLTKNKPLTYEEVEECIKMFHSRKTSDYAWIVPVSDIKDYDLSAKNPAKIVEIVHRSPDDIVADIVLQDTEIQQTFGELQKLISENKQR